MDDYSAEAWSGSTSASLVSLGAHRGDHAVPLGIHAAIRASSSGKPFPALLPVTFGRPWSACAWLALTAANSVDISRCGLSR
jgi:hypothetical protein